MILAVITAAGALKPLEEWTTLFIWPRKHYEKIQNALHSLLQLLLIYLHFVQELVTLLILYFLLSQKSRESGIRPERPMSIAVIASQQAITASPISAATVALLAMLADYKITLLDILKVSIPSTFIACMIAAFVASKMGKELNEDPEYLKRLKEGMIPKIEEKKNLLV